MTFKKYRASFFYNSVDQQGNPKQEFLGTKEFFDFGKMCLTSLAFLRAEPYQLKANAVSFTRLDE
jgi:hypothetical protein